MDGMLRGRWVRTGLELFEAYSFNQPTRQGLSYADRTRFEFSSVSALLCACAFCHVYSFDGFE